MSLPIIQGLTPQNFSQFQTLWANQLNPIISNPLSGAVLLTGVTLTAGSNTINTTLGKKLSGWILTGINSPVTLYDTQSSNPTPSLTLQLVASGPCVVNLVVF